MFENTVLKAYLKIYEYDMSRNNQQSCDDASLIKSKIFILLAEQYQNFLFILFPQGKVSLCERNT